MQFASQYYGMMIMALDLLIVFQSNQNMNTQEKVETVLTQVVNRCIAQGSPVIVGVPAIHPTRSLLERINERTYTVAEWVRVHSELPTDGIPVRNVTPYELSRFKMPNGSHFVTLIDGSEDTFEKDVKWMRLASRVDSAERKIECALGLLRPLGNQVTPSLMAIREAISILQR